MVKHTQTTPHLLHVSNFDDLINTPFKPPINAISWSRELAGDFEEIIHAIDFEGNILELDEEDLMALNLCEAGKTARNTILSDIESLTKYGAAPVLNIIKYYEADEHSFFSTDVYSFHVDRSPIATDTFLCTYFGATSEIIPNEQAIQKIQLPEIREKLLQSYKGEIVNFENYLSEHFFDLHYEALPNAAITRAGIGDLWRLAVDHPKSEVLPCIHRAPKEKKGQKRLLLIC